MPGCCVVGCTNSRAKGFKVYLLPRGKYDQDRRNQWILNIKRTNFTPTPFTVICEVHFEKDQFEPKRPGKLKHNAVPTIFNYNQKKIKRKCRRKNCKDEHLISTDDCTTKVNSTINEHSYYSKKKDLSCETQLVTNNNEGTFFIDEQEERLENEQPSVAGQTSNATLCNLLSNQIPPNLAVVNTGSSAPVYLLLANNQTANSKSVLQIIKPRPVIHTIKSSSVFQNINPKIFHDTNIKSEKLRKRIKQLKLQLLASNRQRKKLEREKNNITSNLTKIFTPDQILSLKYAQGKFTSSWSDETIKSALRLKNACGINGYKELYSQGYPLPSLRTLRRRLKTMSDSSGVTADVAEMRLLNGDVTNVDSDRLGLQVEPHSSVEVSPDVVEMPVLNENVANVDPDRLGLQVMSPSVEMHSEVIEMPGLNENDASADIERCRLQCSGVTIEVIESPVLNVNDVIVGPEERSQSELSSAVEMLLLLHENEAENNPVINHNPIMSLPSYEVEISSN